MVLVFAVVALSAAGCAKGTVPQKTQTPQLDLSDDLTKYRPVVESTNSTGSIESTEVVQNEPLNVPFDISEKLKAITDSMLVRNDSIRMISGFTVLVYSGNNEIEAGRVRNRLFDIVPDMEARFSYKLPTYFVKVGQFFQQIEAQPLYRKIREHYPSASIVPDKFPID